MSDDTPGDAGDATDDAGEESGPAAAATGGGATGTGGDGAAPGPDGWSREAAVDRLDELVRTVETERMPVPIREVWAFGDLVLGVDPVERLDVYVTKDLLFKDAPDREAEFRERLGVEGVGKTVSAAWADDHPDAVRANANGHAAPEKCLAAHLFEPDEPVHLEVCNTGFEDNVTQRLRGARAREDYTQLLDMDAEEAERAATEFREYKREQAGQTVRGDVV